MPFTSFRLPEAKGEYNMYFLYLHYHFEKMETFPLVLKLIQTVTCKMNCPCRLSESVCLYKGRTRFESNYFSAYEKITFSNKKKIC